MRLPSKRRGRETRLESPDNAEILGRESGQALDPAKLIAPMIERFMATDRGFAKMRHAARSRSQPAGSAPPRGE
ncbi:MAG: DUF2274 domain-containing protein [Enhydrobacter sp.]|nr:DUF2274 domain-containing protein [Rhizobiaceae bacterium]MCA3572026.1 DUF2274 domain-containing protein [Bradyrhizobium sp.]MCA3580520.1 DUF2274 domain-containing protein [Bradyrhizobium sp.]UYN97835.1 MAG: DUF2274 domain-containing protein [Enhydrobacter sp.]